MPIASRLATTVGLALVAIALGATSASAAIEIGQTAPAPATLTCGGATAFLQKTVAAGSPSYTVPGVGVITSWSTQAAGASGKDAELKLFAPTGTPGSYTVRGQEGPHVLTAGVLNTFPAQIPVQPGDILGLYYSTNGTACQFTGVAGDTTTYKSGINPDPLTGTTYVTNNTDPAFRVNVSARFEPSNTFTLGDVVRNKKKGTATLTVNVPNPGELAVSGNGVKTAAGAQASATVTAPGEVKLLIRAKGKKKKKLNSTGKVKVNPTITYTPTGGDPSTQSTKVKLKKR